MPSRWVDHTAELELHVSTATEATRLRSSCRRLLARVQATGIRTSEASAT